MPWITLGPTDAFPSGTMKAVKVDSQDGRDILVCNNAGEFLAAQNTCPHKGGALSQGWLKDAVVTCPWHRFRFDLHRGCSVTDTTLTVQTYQTKVEDTVLKIQL